MITKKGPNLHLGRSISTMEIHQGKARLANMEDFSADAVTREKLRVAVVVVKRHSILFKVLMALWKAPLSHSMTYSIVSLFDSNRPSLRNV